VKTNVVESIVSESRCIGCGVCAAICPKKILKIGFNKNGTYEPFQNGECLRACSSCTSVCPFNTANPDGLEINKRLFADTSGKFDVNLGYYLNCVVGHIQDEEQRGRSASGGAGYWILHELLTTNKVDYVITTVPNSDPDKLFKFTIINNIDDLLQSPGSVYYPVELSDVLQYVMENEGRYALTALPCFSKSIRLAQFNNRVLRARIKFVIGLVCGQMKSKQYTEELGKIALGTESIKSVKYRTKRCDSPASKFAYAFEGQKGTKRNLNWEEKPSWFWRNRLFTPIACNFCTDVFAITADVVLMDAWLPPYVKDYKGHSLLVLRNKALAQLIDSKEGLALSDITESEVVRSQFSVIQNKENVRLYITLKSKIKCLPVALVIKMQKMSYNYIKNKPIILMLAILRQLFIRTIRIVGKGNGN